MKILKKTLEGTLSTVKDKEVYNTLLYILFILNNKEEEVVEEKSTMLELPNGAKVWVLNPEELDVNNFDWEEAKFHRDNDQPAIEDSDGSKHWYKEGKRHRENDKPAIIWGDVSKEYWINGERIK